METQLTNLLSAFMRMDTLEKTAACVLIIAIALMLFIAASMIKDAVKRKQADQSDFQQLTNRFKQDKDISDFKDGIGSVTLLFVLGVIILVISNNV